MVRADAAENRERIISAATAAFAADPAMSLNQVAQRAGVGAGTLYRHFPSREDLVLAVYQQEVARIVASVHPLLAQSSPLDALRAWVLDLVAAMRRKHGLGDALTAGAHQAIAEQTYAPVLSAIDELLQAGKRSGALREEADARDVLQLTSALWRAPAEPEDRAPVILDVYLAGLARPR